MSDEVVDTTVGELRRESSRFHGRRIRARGVFHARFEGWTFAGAWFHCRSSIPDGTWLVDVEGRWLSSPSADDLGESTDPPVSARGRYGHMGMFPAELTGAATLVSIATPEVVSPDDIEAWPEYEPLVVHAPITVSTQGWFLAGRELRLMGPQARLPAGGRPTKTPAKAVVCACEGELGVFEWSWMGESAHLEPQHATPAAPGHPGQLVIIEGVLRPCDDDWPMLDGILGVVPPPFSTYADRIAGPQRDVLDAIQRTFGDGLNVRLVGEMGRRNLFAYVMEGPSGPVSLQW